MSLTQDELKRILHYDYDTGIFTWKIVHSRKMKAGDRAGYVQARNGKSYIVISINRRNYRAHRLVWLYIYGKFPKNEIDHVDGDGINNKWLNLRHVTRNGNCKNTRISKRNTSGVVGVYQYDNRWVAQICTDKQRISLGSYGTLFDAACARKSAEIKYGFHKNHGK